MTSEGQVDVDRSDGGRAFADGGRDSLGRSGANVADGKQPRMAGLKWQRGASERLPTPIELLAPQGSVGEHETFIVDGGEARQPLRGGLGADVRRRERRWRSFPRRLGR